MSNLLTGKAALSPELAIRFEKAFGISAATMLRMQAGYDLAQVALRADEIKVERWPQAAWERVSLFSIVSPELRDEID